MIQQQLDLPPVPEPTEAMVDLETLGKKPFCPILSIGAVAFRLDEDTLPDDVFYQAVTLESCLELGLRVDAGTLQWWLNQTKDAQAVFHDAAAVKLPHALDAFTDWLNSRPLTLWGNSARFDMGILEAAYHVCGKELPWPFWKEGCYRTLKNLPGAPKLGPRVGTYHNALDDAMTQALHLREIMRSLNLIPAATPAA